MILTRTRAHNHVTRPSGRTARVRRVPWSHVALAIAVVIGGWSFVVLAMM